jgi:uncharacterized membrane protein YgcG
VPGVRTLLALLFAALASLAPVASAAKSTDSPAGGKDPAATETAEPGAGDTAGDTTGGQGERIISYRSDIVVDRDSSLHITETLRVEAEGRDIRHGIFRDFPTSYHTRTGRHIRVGFTVESVERDGQAEPYDRESISGGVRIKIGDADHDVTPGEHTYVIHYTTTRQLGFFDNFDEIYWNVTGTGWMFPIDAVEARIHLPQPVPFGARAFYTGPEGSTASDAEVASESPGDISFRTTRPLGPHEGLTVSVAWPKGVVTAPPPPSAYAQWMEAHGGVATAILGLIALGFFYFYAWVRAGRGPVPGTVVPLFEPPEGMSAPAVRYVRRMGFDNRCYAAAIVESGVRGKIRLVESEGGFFKSKKTTIEKTGEGDDMPPPERGMLGALFASGDSVDMDKANYQVFGKAKSALEDGLREAYKGKYFLANKGWAWAGLAFMLAVMMLVGAVLVSADTYALPGAGIASWFGVGMFAIALGAAPAGGRQGARGWIALIGAALAGLAGLFCLVAALANTTMTSEVIAILSPLLALPLVVSAFWWMAAPTREGRAVMDQIAGFQRYLSVTEENRLEVLHPPEKTPALFERFLPYAIALGVENKWANRFAGVLAAAAAEPGQQGGSTYMAWYVGSQTPWTDPGRFAAAVGGGLASSVASAATAPGSSSGSGGGGFSGGGGGGGGGGGW